jgi:hypothetical protein
MNLATKIGLGVVALAVVGVVAVRFGGSKAAKSGLDSALSNLPPGWAATHGAVTYDAVSGQAQVDDLVLTHDGKPFLTAGSVLASGIEGVSADAPPTRIGKIVVKDMSGDTYRHVGHLEVDGLEVANLRTLVDPAAYPNGKPGSTEKLKLVTSVDGSDVLVHVNLPPPPPDSKALKITSVDAHVGHFHTEGVSARQFASPPANDSLQNYTFIADAARAIAEDATSVKDITETLPGLGTISIDSASATALHDGKIGALDERDLVFTAEGKPNRFSIDLVSAKDIDLNKALDALPALGTPGSAGKLNGGLKVGQFNVNGLTADFAKAPLVTMISLEGQTTDNSDGTQDGTVKMRTLKITTTGRDTKPEVKLALDRFGMADFVIDLDEAGSYAPAEGHVKIGKADFLFHDLGTLHFAMDASGLQNLSGATGPNQIEALRNVKLASATVQWTDNSLTNRIFKTVAAQTGKSVEDLHAALALPVASLGMFLPNQPDAPAQVSAFLADPKQLTITLAPPSPVSLMDVAKASAQEKAALLGVSVKGD